MSRPAVFLDRDGTINVEKEYLYRIEDWEWIPGAIEAIKRINQMGYLAIVVTNQAGVARGYYGESDVVALHRKVDEMLANEGAWIDGYYYCAHHKEYGEIRDCLCRKPSPGMLFEAKRDFDIDLKKSYMIGDKAIDMQAALNAGVVPIMVMTGYGKVEHAQIRSQVQVERDLLSAVKRICISRGMEK